MLGQCRKIDLNNEEWILLGVWLVLIKKSTWEHLRKATWILKDLKVFTFSNSNKPSYYYNNLINFVGIKDFEE